MSYRKLNSLVPYERERQIPPVTILIGFTCKNAVIMASDSQITYLPGTSKQQEIEKISTVLLADGTYALLAKAGAKDTFDYFQEIFRARAVTAELKNQRDLPNLAEECLKICREKILAPKREIGATSQELAEHAEDISAEMLLGYMHDHIPYLYSMNTQAANTFRVTDKFKALGCGANVAHSVLAGFDLPKMDPIESVGVVGYAVEFCKQHDAACNGRTQLGMVGEDCNGVRTSVFDQDVSSGIEEMAKAVQEEMRPTLAVSIKTNLIKLGIGKQ